MDRYADFMQGDVIRISSSALESMGRIASANEEKKRYRICLHDSPDNRQHEMIICTTKGDYCRPHKHRNMSETHVILKGREQIVFFNNEGKIQDTFILDRDGGDLCYRVNSDVYHMSIPLSDIVVELESKGGPFNPQSNIFPFWAPDGSDYEKINKYVEYILSECASESFCSDTHDDLNISSWEENKK